MIINKLNKNSNKYRKDIYEIFRVILSLSEEENYIKYKKKYIDKFLEMKFVIFPCNLDKTPMIRGWNNINIYQSKSIYNYSKNCIYTSNRNAINNNIGLLCGEESNLLVVDIDLKDNGVKYWKKLLKIHNNSKDINTLKVISGSGGYHYYFKWSNNMKYWHSSNRGLIDSDGNKIGIDIRANNGYIILPPSIHPSNKLYRFKNINMVSDLNRNLIKTLPKWLYDIISSTQISSFNINKKILCKEIRFNITSWYKAIIINKKNNKFLIKYINWDDKYNEWIDINSNRLKIIKDYHKFNKNNKLIDNYIK